MKHIVTKKKQTVGLLILFSGLFYFGYSFLYNQTKEVALGETIVGETLICRKQPDFDIPAPPPPPPPPPPPAKPDLTNKHMVFATAYRATDGVGNANEYLVIGHYDFLGGGAVKVNYLYYIAGNNKRLWISTK